MSERDNAKGRNEGAGGTAWARTVFNLLLTAALLGATAAALYNVYGASSEVELLANESACHGQEGTCKAQFTFWERSPIAHTFAMNTPKGLVHVRCSREYLLLGPWSCKNRDEGGFGDAPAQASAQASTSAAPAKVPAKKK
jgi:hypothetical protein